MTLNIDQIDAIKEAIEKATYTIKGITFTPTVKYYEQKVNPEPAQRILITHNSDNGKGIDDISSDVIFRTASVLIDVFAYNYKGTTNINGKILSHEIARILCRYVEDNFDTDSDLQTNNISLNPDNLKPVSDVQDLSWTRWDERKQTQIEFRHQFSISLSYLYKGS